MVGEKITITTVSKQSLIKNISSLGFLQVSSYIFPLITLPYLVRVLGPEKYGLYNFIIALLSYFNVFIDYGFNFSATRQISILKNDKLKLSEIVSNVYTIKIFFTIISSIILILLLQFVPRLSEEYYAYLIGFSIVVGNALFPFWLYQGLEDTRVFVIINFIFRLIFTVSIFFMVKAESDVNILLGLNGGSSVLIGLVAIFALIIKGTIKLKFPRISSIKKQLSEGKDIFISNLGINLYTSSNTVILGFLTDNTVVGIFSAADKIRLAIQSLFTPFSQALFPRFAELFRNSIQEAKLLLQKVTKYVLAAEVIILILVFMFAETIVSLLLGTDFSDAVLTLRLLSFLPLIISMSNISGIMVMLNIGKDRNFKKIVLTAAVIN
ncbi:MAG: flippase, partial [Ignavibacteriaceae bacterium]|nr:flippase [Ignavibacteriaceae bacterium]